MFLLKDFLYKNEKKKEEGFYDETGVGSTHSGL